MRNGKYPLIVAMMAATLVSSVSATPLKAPGTNCKYFAETGHYVCDEFLDFYETRGDLEIFGYPLTERFHDDELDLDVQYFQRARMELHQLGSDSYQVKLGSLVDELGYDFSAVDPSQLRALNASAQRYFPEAGHTVSYAFLDFFLEHGGLEIFGYPRSEMTIGDGYVVQYFQRVRMEWHPEAFPSPQVRLTNLGETYIERFGVPRDYDRPVNPTGRIAEDAVSASPSEERVTQIAADASVRHIISAQEGLQTVFVYVTDQKGQPVEGAFVEMAVRNQQDVRRYEFAPTDESGFTRHSFDIFPAFPGRKVLIDVTVSYANLTTTAQAFFLSWW